MIESAKKLIAAPIVCSFCDNDQGQVAHIIVGKPGIAICDECVATCVQTITIACRNARGLKTKLGGQG